MQLPQVLLVVQDVEQAEGEHAHHVQREGEQEQEEVAVVPPPDAVVDPGTVVVKVLQRGEKQGVEKKVLTFS